MARRKNWKHFDMEERIQDHEGGTERPGQAQHHGDKDAVKIARPPGYPDNAGHVLDLGAIDIKRPPIPESDTMMSHSPDMDWSNDELLINELMEENRRLDMNGKRLEEKVKEATTANEKWYRYNEGIEQRMEKMQKKIMKVECDLNHEKAEHAETREKLEKLRRSGVDTMEQTCGEKGGNRAEKDNWLERENEFLKDELAHVQQRLRDVEMRGLETSDLSDWNCPRCTLENPGDAGKCAACGYKAEKTVTYGRLEPDGLMFHY